MGLNTRKTGGFFPPSVLKWAKRPKEGRRVAMKKKSGRRTHWILFGIWLAAIFGQSLLPAEISGAESGALLSRLGAALLPLTHWSLRKIAHFTEFAVLGLLLAQCLPARPVHSLFGSLLCALSDETIQLFVRGRSGQVRDIWIDFAGAAAAIVLTELVRLIIRRIRYRGKAPA